MSHSVTMFQDFNLTNMVFLLVNYSSKTNTKIRIRRNEILTKSLDRSGYYLSEEDRLMYMENHENSGQTKLTMKDYLKDLRYIQTKSHLRVKEIQKFKNSTKSRILTKKQILLAK